MVFVFYGYLAGDILALEWLVGRQPCIGGSVGFILIRLSINGKKIKWVLT